jgi:hypothetical protein
MGKSFLPGTETWYASDSPSGNFSVIFEDDGDTGYCYAYDRASSEEPILDAVHLYNAASVLDRNIESIVEIIWSEDGLKAAVQLNEYPHAVIDFGNRCSHSRTNFPDPPENWKREVWDDDLMTVFHGGS